MDDDFPEIDDFGALDELISQRKVKNGNFISTGAC